MSTQVFDFTGSQGHPLSGRLEIPATVPVGWAIFAHCFTCGKDSLAATRITRALAERGIGVLRFDFAGIGSSAGEFANFAGDLQDLIAAAQAMQDAGMAPTLMIGHSLGGAAVLSAAGRIASVRAVATIGAPSDLKHLLHHFDALKLAAIEAEGQAEVALGARTYLVRKSFIQEMRDGMLLADVAILKRSLLILHAPQDATVAIEHAAMLYAAAKHPKSFISLDDADHLLTRRADADYVASLIAGWASRYLS